MSRQCFVGHGFSRAIRRQQQERALAPEGLQRLKPENILDSLDVGAEAPTYKEPVGRTFLSAAAIRAVRREARDRGVRVF